MADRGIRLQRYEISNAAHLHNHVFRLKVVASEANNMPREVFVFRRRPVDPNTGDEVDEFLTVASVVDLSEYPIDDPDPTAGNPFFRKHTVEVDVRSTAIADEVWSVLHAQVCVLVNAMNRAEQLVLAETVTCGEIPADTSDSESVS